MSYKQYLGRILLFSLIVVVTSLMVSSLFGQPVLCSYVETGSMSPTLDAGDGFIAVPAQVTGPVEEGDVIVYEAEEVQGGGLTTHRVVGETEQGYITRGDANPFTDQDNDEPPVKDAQIKAKALQVNGKVVVIPHLGTVVQTVQSAFTTVQRTLAGLFGSRSLLGVQGLAYLFFATTLAWYLVGRWRAGTTKRRRRETSRTDGTNVRLVVGALAAVLVLGATAAMVAPAGTQEYGVVSAEFDSERPTVIPAGESNDVSYPVANGGVVPTVSYLESASEGVEVKPQQVRVGPGEVTNATVTLHAPPETGHYRRYVVEHRYLSVLPPSVIRSLYGVHPWLPVVVIDALIGMPFYLLGVRLAGTGRLRDRSRRDRLSLTTRLRRLVEGRY